MIFRTTGVTVLSFLFSISTQQNIHAAAPATSAGALKTAVDSQERKMHFEDDAAEYVSKAAPAASAAGSAFYGAASSIRTSATDQLTPLARLYQTRFAQGHAHLWQTMRAPFLPITPAASNELSKQSPFGPVAWYPNGDQLAAAIKDKAVIWNIKNDRTITLQTKEKRDYFGENTQEVEGRDLKPGDSATERDETIGTIAVNCDGTQLATVTKRDITIYLGYRYWRSYDYIKDHIVRFWDAQTGAQLKSFVFDGPTQGPLWHPLTPAKFAFCQGKNAFIHDSYQNAFLLTRYSDQSMKKATLEHESDIVSALWSNDGGKLITNTKESSYAWNAVRPQEFYRAISDYFSTQDFYFPIPSQTITPLILEWADLTEKGPETSNMPAAAQKDSAMPMVDSSDKTSVNHNAGLPVQCIDKNAYVLDATTGEKLYALPHNELVQSIVWNPDNARLATVAGRTVKVWDTSPYRDFITGAITPEQFMLVCADPCKKFRQRHPHYVPFSLKTFARHMQSPGVSTYDLAQTLLSFHPDIRRTFLKLYNISTQRQILNVDNSQEDYLESYKAFEQVQKTAQVTIDDQMVPLTKYVAQTLKEYIVEDSQSVDKKADEQAQLFDMSTAMGHERFVQEAMPLLFAALEAQNQHDINHYINPVLIVTHNPQKNNRTPLMEAIMHCSPAHQYHEIAHSQEMRTSNLAAPAHQYHEIAHRLLTYQEPFAPDAHSKEMRTSNLAATDYDGNTPLILAIERKCFNLALKIAQKMEQDPSLHPAFAYQRENGNILETAYSIAMDMKDGNDRDTDYQSLLHILERHKNNKYLLTPIPAEPYKAKELSALEKLYLKQFPQGHAAQWQSIINPLLPCEIVPTQLKYPAYIDSLLWANNGSKLITVSGQNINIWRASGEYEGGIDCKWCIRNVALNHSGTALAILTGKMSFCSRGLGRQYYTYTMHVWNTDPIEPAQNPYQLDEVVIHNEYGQMSMQNEYIPPVSCMTWRSGSAPHVSLYRNAESKKSFSRFDSWGHERFDYEPSCSQSEIDREQRKGTLPSSWDYKKMEFVPSTAKQTAYVCDEKTKQELYALPAERDAAIVTWDPQGAQLATVSKNGSGVKIWNLKDHNEFIEGSRITPDQVMLTNLLAKPCAQFRKKYPSYVPYSLKDCARHMQQRKITTAELSRALLKFKSSVMNTLLAHYTICTKRVAKNHDDSPQEDYLESYKAFAQAKEIVPKGVRGEIEQALEEYIVDARAHLNPADEADERCLQTRAQQNKKFLEETVHKLFAAIEAHDLKAIREHLNPESVIAKNPHKFNRTALMHALEHCSPEIPEHKQILETVLHYQERSYPDLLKDEIRESDLVALDEQGKMPLEIAMNKGRFTFALQILQRMHQNILFGPVLERLTSNEQCKALMAMANIFSKHDNKK